MQAYTCASVNLHTTDARPHPWSGAGVAGSSACSHLRKRLLADILPSAVQAAIEAIVEPRRREILRLVRDEEMTAGRIATHFDVTRQAISQHLGVLRSAGLVSERRDGTRRIYRVRPEGLTELRAFLDDFWSDRLKKLKHEIEAEEKSRGANRDHR
jgi:DNA-binding transcriptional ArsR family regulator